ncbi:transport permease protein [Halobacillus andaensis]|uniref:Transport permease protein n=1 Tax=Halobacillus andaensis TaxID=1176239 RepID=A0A917B4T3_HALAA|nr:ABC transporter permease [Halobacillus andaensis]MBP2004649.1 ABC-2 type transport system permease protein [Halobacillus andaensis]GGF20026.1 transport permease protein [Halobacillus andaensis]
MNTWTITRRIFTQFRRDKRSMALMILAPIFVFTLMWLVLDSDENTLEIATIGVPSSFTEHLSAEEDVNVTSLSEAEAKEEIAEATIDAFILWKDGQPAVTIEGSDPNITSSIKDLLQNANREVSSDPFEVYFWHGSDDLELFDYIGPVLIGFFVFFFVFIVGGVSFLRERTQGTLERILSTPLKRSELVFGYLLGFGLFTILQSFLIAAYSIYVLDVYMEGYFLYVLLVTFLLALTALCLGTLLSAFAKNEFQMIQFIPLVIVPQVFFSGLFPIEGMAYWLQAIGKVMPLTYGAEALRGIMLRSEGFADFQSPLYILLGFIILFTVLNIFALKRHRSL